MTHYHTKNSERKSTATVDPHLSIHHRHTTASPKPTCLAIIPISSCVANKPASPSAVSVTSATANALFATHTSVPPPSPASATNAPSATTRTNASCAVAKASQTPFTASSAQDWRRTGMGVRRLSIWVVRGRICSTRRRIFGITSTGGWRYVPGYQILERFGEWTCSLCYCWSGLQGKVVMS